MLRGTAPLSEGPLKILCPTLQSPAPGLILAQSKIALRQG
jgi:hypothetical protein